MAANSKIEWTDHTFNPWIGCTKRSNGCKNCYAEAQMDKWLRRAEWGDSAPRVRTSDKNWAKLLKWDRALDGTGRRQRVFCASLSDIFEIPKINPIEVDEWRRQLWTLIDGLANLDMLLLTKRPENIRQLVPEAWETNWPAHVWTGTSMEDQQSANDRYFPIIKSSPGKHFLSIEPLLEPINLGYSDYIDWIIIGGESGPNARPLKTEWVEDIVIQCGEAGVPVFVKQLGQVWAKENSAKHKKSGDITEWPKSLQVRQIPVEFQGA